MNQCPRYREDKEQKMIKKYDNESSDEPTCRCHQNPFIGALGIQQPVILGEPQIDQRKLKTG